MKPFHIYDVFTTHAYAGNPLAIVEEAEGLSVAQMQLIAREFNLSETIFVLPPARPAHRARVRIFFPTAEIPFAGHPTIGCAIHLAATDHGPGDFECDLVLEEEAGLVPVRVWRKGDEIRARFQAPVLPEPHPGAGPGASAEVIAAALDLAPGAIGFDAHRPAAWAGGPAFLYVPVADLATLARARPIEPHWSALMAAARVDSAYLYTPGAGSDFQARMFSPTAGIPEDPATGSASAILAAQLQAAGLIGRGAYRFDLRQGVEMGRPSQIVLGVEADGDGIRRITVEGSACPVSTGRLHPPAQAHEERTGP